MKRIGVDVAGCLIDFDPRGGERVNGFGRSQLEGTIAAHNMLVENGVAYIADEVGMGKTYVALGVMGLVRHFDPAARIVVIAPRENIQLKWIKELRNFVEHNWRVTDGRVKSIQGAPVREPLACHSLAELAQAAALNADRDLFLRMTSFSLALKQPRSRMRYRKDLKSVAPWIDGRTLSARKRPEEFRDAYGRALNAILPTIDLLVVDEAHNLKHGFRERGGSNRNRILGLALGHESGGDTESPWYGSKVKNLLMLSATPFETDFEDLFHQLDVLGKGRARVRRPGGKPRAVRQLVAEDASEEAEAGRREIVEDLLIRRVSWLDIAGQGWTKNMYRREWRSGGYGHHDEPLRIEDPRQRLIVGLVQKKVAEVIGSERFNNSFQIGMLSSFESFLETITRQKKGEDEEAERTFEGDQDASGEERRGADSLVLSGLLASHRERFDRALPHPKLDATAQDLADVFRTGEKAIVFVRRVATVRELAGKLNRVFDDWIRARLEEALPELRVEIGEIFERYRNESRAVVGDGNGTASRAIDGGAGEGDDEGGTDSFFAWFFRGEGPEGLLSGAAFQKNRLGATSAAYSTLFEDDTVSWLLGRPADVLEALGRELDLAGPALEAALRKAAWGLWRSQQRERYPRYYVFESYQAGTLDLLAARGQDAVAERARCVRSELWPDLEQQRSDDPPRGFPGPETAIGVTTFFTALVGRPELRNLIWPDPRDFEFKARFRRREQRRALISAMARLGAAYIDLYLLAIRQVGSFRLRERAESEGVVAKLAHDFVELLDRQREQSGFHACSELAAAAEAFDTLLTVNFPGASSSRLPDLAEIFGRALQHQVPVGAMSGGVNRRLVGQFRMPGFPLVLVTTDVLQEGEDLHTFCRKIVHYGIAWTPSAMEQRTGRIDRIDSLVQRRLDGTPEAPDPGSLIQVHYPHLQGTVEVLQVRRVLQRLDRFMRLVHRHGRDGARHESRLDTLREILTRGDDLEPLEGPLTSAFPVREEWLQGAAELDRLHRLDVEPLVDHLEVLWARLSEELLDGVHLPPSPYVRRGRVRVREGVVVCPGEGAAECRRQGFELQLRSHPLLDHALLHCRSPVGVVDLDQTENVDALYELQRDLGHPRICVRPLIRGGHAVTVEEEMIFHPETTQYEEFELLVRRSCGAADEIERHVLDRDVDEELGDG